jgi:hypothetical protein
MTEHTDYLTPDAAAAFVVDCHRLSDESFVFVPGFEVPYKQAHVLHVGASSFQTSFANNADELLAWRGVSPLVVLAHPVRNNFIVDETLLACLDGIEIWNQQYEGKVVPRTQSVSLLQQLRMKKKLIATGGIDLHRAEHLGSPYTVIDVSTLSETVIVEALRAGAYTFGTKTRFVGALEDWKPNLYERLASAGAIVVIAVGKFVNATLARVGIKLPKRLVRAIRGRV